MAGKRGGGSLERRKIVRVGSTLHIPENLVSLGEGSGKGRLTQGVC